jgi:hypothetical protein
MDRSVQMRRTIPDESTLRTWEDMRSQVLHELQEGAVVADDVVDSMSQLVVMLKLWRLGKGPLGIELSGPGWPRAASSTS